MEVHQGLEELKCHSQVEGNVAEGQASEFSVSIQGTEVMMQQPHKRSADTSSRFFSRSLAAALACASITFRLEKK